MLLVWIVDDERWMLDVDVDFGGTNAPIHPTSNKRNNNTTQHKQQQQHPTQTTPHTQQPPQRGLEAPPLKVLHHVYLSLYLGGCAIAHPQETHQQRQQRRTLGVVGLPLQ